MGFSLKSVYKRTKRLGRKPGRGGIGALLLGIPAQHLSQLELKDYKHEKEDKTIADAEASEKAAVETERLATAKTKLEAQRKKRRGSAGRKGRRASIMSGPLGAGKEPEVRRAGILGA